MELTITGAVVATLISAIVSASISIYISKKNERKSLSDRLDAIIKIWIQYPYLESTHFTNKWKNDFDRSDERWMRYEAYGTLLFNFLHDVADHFKYDAKKVEDYIAIKNWVRIHKKYWENPIEPHGQISDYGEKFANFIDRYVKGVEE